MTVNVDGSHASDESGRFRNASADHISAAGPDAEQAHCFHRSSVDGENEKILADRQHDRVPATVVEHLGEVVEQDLVRTFHVKLHFDLAILQEHLDVAGRRETVVREQAILLVSAQIHRHVQRGHSVESGQVGVGTVEYSKQHNQLEFQQAGYD